MKAPSCLLLLLSSPSTCHNQSIGDTWTFVIATSLLFKPERSLPCPRGLSHMQVTILRSLRNGTSVISLNFPQMPLSGTPTTLPSTSLPPWTHLPGLPGHYVDQLPYVVPAEDSAILSQLKTNKGHFISPRKSSSTVCIPSSNLLMQCITVS